MRGQDMILLSTNKDASTEARATIGVGGFLNGEIQNCMVAR